MLLLLGLLSLGIGNCPLPSVLPILTSSNPNSNNIPWPTIPNNLPPPTSHLRLERAEGEASTPPRTFSTLATWSTSASGRACILPTPPPAACTIWSTRSSIIRSTRRWPASPARSRSSINNDGSVTVEDNGRGIPVEEHPDLGFSTLQGVMCALKFGGKFPKRGLSDSRGIARRRRDRGQFPLRMVRSRGPPPRARLPAGNPARRAARPMSAVSDAPIAAARRPPSRTR